MLLNLLSGFAHYDLDIDLLAIRAAAVPRDRLPARVRLIDLRTRHSLLALPAVTRYLRQQQPDALLAAKDRAIRTALRARRLARVDTRIVGRLGTNLSAALAQRSGLQRWLRQRPLRRLYRDIDKVVAVSQGVAEDTRTITGLPADKLCVVRNPVITPRLNQQAATAVSHPWLTTEEQPPVILAAGRLTRQKDFATLLRAFAHLRSQQSVRLIILGEGGLRQELTALARSLNIDQDVDLPGHADNPYPLMAGAQLFVLSSAWEGSPNVLTEALALGTPVVATDCPSGPREILEHGKFGPLVAVGDDLAMAQAMQQVLQQPLPAVTLAAAVGDYTLDTSTCGYLQALGINPDNPGPATTG